MKLTFENPCPTRGSQGYGLAHVEFETVANSSEELGGLPALGFRNLLPPTLYLPICPSFLAVLLVQLLHYY